MAAKARVAERGRPVDTGKGNGIDSPPEPPERRQPAEIINNFVLFQATRCVDLCCCSYRKLRRPGICYEDIQETVNRRGSS